MIYYIYCSIDDSIFLQFRNLKHLFVIQSLSLSKTFLHLFLTEYFSPFLRASHMVLYKFRFYWLYTFTTEFIILKYVTFR